MTNFWILLPQPMFYWPTTSTSLLPLDHPDHLLSPPPPRSPSSRSPSQALRPAQVLDFIVVQTRFARRRPRLQGHFQEVALHAYPWLLGPQERTQMPPSPKVCKWSAKCAQGFAIWNKNFTRGFHDFAVEHLTAAHLDTPQIWLPRNQLYPRVPAGFW